MPIVSFCLMIGLALADVLQFVLIDISSESGKDFLFKEVAMELSMYIHILSLLLNSLSKVSAKSLCIFTGKGVSIYLS